MTDENKVPEEIVGTSTEKKTNTRKRRNYKKEGGTQRKRTTQNQNIFKKSNIKIIYKFLHFLSVNMEKKQYLYFRENIDKVSH